MEGKVEISYGVGVGVFLIDGCLLSEFVQLHFQKKQSGMEHLQVGKCKIIIVPIHE